VADQHDAVNALVDKRCCFVVNSPSNVGIDDDISWAGNVGQAGSDGANDTNSHARSRVGHDGRRRHAALVGESLQCRFGADVDVGRQEWHGHRTLVKPETFDETRRDVGTEVKVVVAETHGLVEPTQGDRIEQRVVWIPKSGRELLRGQEVVARCDAQQDVGIGSAAELDPLLCEPGDTWETLVGVGQQF